MCDDLVFKCYGDDEFFVANKRHCQEMRVKIVTRNYQRAMKRYLEMQEIING